MMFSTLSIDEYTESLLAKNNNRLDIDSILLSMLHNIDLHMYYISDSNLNVEIYKFGTETTKDSKFIQLYLNPNGGFNTIYDKTRIKTFGICQSIILDVIYY